MVFYDSCGNSSTLGRFKKKVIVISDSIVRIGKNKDIFINNSNFTISMLIKTPVQCGIPMSYELDFRVSVQGHIIRDLVF